MGLVLRSAAYALVAAFSAAAAAGVAALALGSPERHAVSAAPRPGAQAARIVYRYLAALRDHDWPGACTLVEQPAACLQGLSERSASFGRFTVIAATASRGRAVASVTVDGIPCRVTLVRNGSQWLIREVVISSDASATRAPAGSTALGA